MAHESFEDDQVAELVNRELVAIKVDREERPDVDAVYMSATQRMTGHGGWPMTVFATPDGEPFFCGTYYPREAFIRLVDAIASVWRERRDDAVKQGAAVVAAVAAESDRLATALGGAVVSGVVSASLLDDAAASLLRDYDPVHGGFGGAPKFPPHMVLLFLLRQYWRTRDERVLSAVRHTCTGMARGGMYDQLAGGFARYSVDGQWLVPHFEKMLYDNALLLRVYTQLWRLTGERMPARIAAETAQFLLSMQDHEHGGFISSLDADTGGVEGATYVWTPAQLRQVLDAADAALAAELFGVTDTGTFEHGTSVLCLTRDVDGADPATQGRWRSVRTRLAQARQVRPQPARDEKVVAAWCGLAITALVEFALTCRSLAGPDPGEYEAAAIRAAQALASRQTVAGRLRRVARAGVAGEPAGVLEDYGCVAEAFCALHQLTGDGRWLTAAGSLLEVAQEHFADRDDASDSGKFFDTPDDGERLITRPADPTDNATPSGRAAIAAAMTGYAALTGQSRWRQRAEQAVATTAVLMRRYARFTGYSCLVAEALLSGPYEIAIADPDPDSALARAAWRLAPPGAVVVCGEPDRPGVPLLAGRPMVGGHPTAYVCRGFVCDRPVTELAELAAALT